MGGAALRRRNHDLAVSAAREIARDWGTALGAPEEIFGAMATVRLPDGLPADWATAEALKAEAWAARRAEVHVMAFAGALWARLSVQAYNTREECLALGAVLSHARAALMAARTAPAPSA
jgi:isopenicillin-N epimerase